MIARLAFAAFMAAFAGSAHAATEIQFDQGAKAKTYRKLLIEPAQVQFDRDFLNDTRAIRGASRRYNRAEIDQMAHEIGENYRAALAEAFRSRGFEIAAAPGNDVLRISPSLKDVYVNQSKGSRTGELQTRVRDAGHARMVVEGSDASGSRVLTASREGTAGETAAFQVGSDVSNRAWFDAMFRDWANELAVALKGAK